MLTLERNPSTVQADAAWAPPAPPRPLDFIARPVPAVAPPAPSIDEPLLDEKALRWLPLAVPLLGLSILCSMAIIWFML